MSKCLIVKDNTSIPNNKIGDVIATYPAQQNIYSKDDFLNLTEFDELASALQSEDPQQIYDAKYNLARKICTKEQLAIFDGLYDLLEFDQKTLNELQADIQTVIPERKECWIDPDTQEVKEIIKEPIKQVRWDGEKFIHNYDDPENATVVNSSASILEK